MSRKFEGFWIPAAVWEDERLSATEKILAAEVASFTRRGAEFYKTNETIAQQLKVSTSTIKRAIATLTETGYIERGPFDGRKRTLRSQIDLSARPKSTTSKIKTNQLPVQNEPAARPKRAHSKTTRKTKSKTITKVEGQWPWAGSEATWLAWIEYKTKEHRFAYKSEISAQAAIDQLLTLSNHDETTAKAIIKQSIANGWKGFFPIKRTQAVPTTEDAAKFANYIRTGNL